MVDMKTFFRHEDMKNMFLIRRHVLQPFMPVGCRNVTYCLILVKNS